MTNDKIAKDRIIGRHVEVTNKHHECFGEIGVVTDKSLSGSYWVLLNEYTDDIRSFDRDEFKLV